MKTMWSWPSSSAIFQYEDSSQVIKAHPGGERYIHTCSHAPSAEGGSRGEWFAEISITARSRCSSIL